MKKGVCTYCGSNIEFSAGKSEMVCPYCKEQIKTLKAEKRLLELQRERRRAIAFLVSFVVFGLERFLLSDVLGEKKSILFPM
ncbi:MAG: hypothetical protein IK033_04690 [Verrucomicrobia bacterium]|nr:hypothetical protein [Verrucomicrobiota bacterium]